MRALICSCQPEKREPSYSSVKRNVCIESRYSGKNQIRHQRQMIRSDQRPAAAMEERLFDPEVMVEIDVIQMQQRQQRRIAARSREVRAQIA